MTLRDEVLTVWLDELGPKRWYDADEELDGGLRERFLDPWEVARAGGFDDWSCDAKGALAFIILTDQLPRNMHRDSPLAYATDHLALAAAKRAVDWDRDCDIPEPERQFFYLPLMHSETLSDQDRAVRLISERMPETGASNLRHARAHREVIRRYGRFPHRNAALGRHTSHAEQKFLDEGGYAAILKEFPEQQAA